MTSEILGIEEIIESQSDKFVTHNRGLRQFEGQTTRVLSRTVFTTPGAPALGDNYIIPASGVSGVWVGHENEIAHWFDPGDGTPAWSYYPPVEGAQLVWVNDEDNLVVWDGAEWRLPITEIPDQAIIVASVGGVLTLDYSAGQHFIVILQENITSVVFIGGPIAPEPFSFMVEFIQTAAYTVTGWAAPFRWSSATPPVITATVGNADVFLFVSRDSGGNIWSHDFTRDTTQDAVELIGEPQMNTFHNGSGLGLTQWSYVSPWPSPLTFHSHNYQSIRRTSDTGQRNSNGLPRRDAGTAYVEMQVTNLPAPGSESEFWVGLNSTVGTTYPGKSGEGIGVRMSDGMVRANGIDQGAFGGFAVDEDIIMLAFDFDQQHFYYGVNGVWLSGNPLTATSPITASWGLPVGTLWRVTVGCEGLIAGQAGAIFHFPEKTQYVRPISFDQWTFGRNGPYGPQEFAAFGTAAYASNLWGMTLFQGEPTVSSMYGTAYLYRFDKFNAGSADVDGIIPIAWANNAATTGGKVSYYQTIDPPRFSANLRQYLQPLSGKFYWEEGGNQDGGHGLIDDTGVPDYSLVEPREGIFAGATWCLYWDYVTGKLILNGVDTGMAPVIPSSSRAYAVDLNAGLLWLSADGGLTWINAGNPATGANPAFALLPGVDLRIFSHIRGTFTQTRGMGADTNGWFMKSDPPVGYRQLSTEGI